MLQIKCKWIRVLTRKSGPELSDSDSVRYYDPGPWHILSESIQKLAQACTL